MNSSQFAGINRDMLRVETEQSRLRDLQAITNHRIKTLEETRVEFIAFKKDFDSLVYAAQVLRSQIADLRTQHTKLVNEIRSTTCKRA